MQEMIVFWLPWVLSTITVLVMHMAGNKYRWTWHLALMNQMLWFTWIIASASWGLLPMAVVLTWVYINNLFKWRE